MNSHKKPSHYYDIYPIVPTELAAYIIERPDEYVVVERREIDLSEGQKVAEWADEIVALIHARGHCAHVTRHRSEVIFQHPRHPERWHQKPAIASPTTPVATVNTTLHNNRSGDENVLTMSVENGNDGLVAMYLGLLSEDDDEVVNCYTTIPDDIESFFAMVREMEQQYRVLRASESDLASLEPAVTHEHSAINAG